jgi:uncharacterized protein (DUF983 family)
VNLFDFLLWEATVLTKCKDGWEINCDKCSEGELLDAETWNDALQEMQAAKWRSVQKDGAWAHLCPACYEAYRNDKPIGPS